MAKQKPVPATPALERPENGVMIVSTGQPGGRRRAGYAFTVEPQEILLDDLDDDQVIAITGDKLLSVKIVVVAPAAPAA